ncbi:MAG: DegT/DnrJ/EryC1/StrS family aminotransferase [Armatimonadota bacterium]
MEIPMVDLRAQYLALRDEVLAAFDEALQGMQLNLGPNVRAFEREWAQYCDARYAVGVGNGTEALHLLLRAHDIGPGDEVITASFTFIASIEAIIQAGATPVLVDIDPESFCISPACVAEGITPRTRAIMPVHLYGHPADMDGLVDAIDGRDILLLADAAQAHGARYRGRPVGSLGDGAAFSFYLSKNLAAYGEGGAITTSDARIDERVRALRVHGSLERYVHRMVGYNSRLDELQAAVLRIKLRHLDAWNEARRRHAARYDAALSGLPDLRIPHVAPWAESAFHLYTIRSPRRDELAQALARANIGHAIHYRVPGHLQEALADLGYGRGSLPETERAADEVLSLPMYPELEPEQIDRVCEVVAATLR